MTSEQLVNRMFFGATFVGGFIAYVAAGLATAAVGFASTKFGYYADNVFGREQYSKDWGETGLMAGFGLFVVIWIVALRRCLRARKHFMWFRVQN
ncbi:MAG: hypothetical protein F9K29_18250 [Hyphomicrobiaceae bacterium]|nr:MAG: hypothetical protein F9K29_18250 [Hyphomicrobiaceae bacterium]